VNSVYFFKAKKNDRDDPKRAKKEPLRTFWGAFLKLARFSARPKILATPFPHYEKKALRGKKWRVFVMFARTKTAKIQRFKNKCIFCSPGRKTLKKSSVGLR